MLPFIVFVLLVVFATLYAIHAAQVKRIVDAGGKAWSHIPAFIVKSFSHLAYVSVSVVCAWVLILVGGLIANANQDPVLQKYPGIGWAALWFFILAVVYAFLWLKNRPLEIR